MAILIEPTMSVGFTGSQQGMTDLQYNTVKNLMMAGHPKELHHGDCIGADSQMHEIAIRAAIDEIVIHPPDLPGKRSFCFGTDFARYRPEKPYLDRNHDIVDETDILIACPATTQEVLRSGTWATIRYAEKHKRTILLIYPSGKIFKISEGFGRSR